MASGFLLLGTTGPNELRTTFPFRHVAPGLGKGLMDDVLHFVTVAVGTQGEIDEIPEGGMGAMLGRSISRRQLVRSPGYLLKFMEFADSFPQAGP